MIQQIQLVLSPPNDVRIPQSWSYRLYGWLMSQISSEFGEQLHLQGEHPIAHFLCFSPNPTDYSRDSKWVLRMQGMRFEGANDEEKG